MGGKQAGLVGLLSVIAEGHEVSCCVAYDVDMRDVVYELNLNKAESIHDAIFKINLEQADVLLSVHGREIVPDFMLDSVRFGGINLHPCLSRHKGAEPIKQFLESNDSSMASVGAHVMSSEVDGGEVLVEKFKYVTSDTVVGVYNELYPVYASVIFDVLRGLKI